MKLFYLLPILLLTACASNPKPVVTHLTQAGTILPSEGTESVRYSENIQAYNLGRYIDPSDHLVMHERHVVYRVETTAKWNLHPNAPVMVPTGPVIGLVDPARQASPVTPEVVAEVNRQKTATQTIIDQGNRMNQALSQLSQGVSATRQIAEDTAQLKAEAIDTKKRLDALEDQFRKRQTETFTTPQLTTKATDGW